MDVQVPLVNEAMVYVLVVAGLTFTVIDGAVPLKAMPLERVPEMVPEPVIAKDNVAEPPLQILVVPLRTAVDLGLTVTVALPVSSAGMDVQIPLVNVAMLYVVVVGGLTFTVIVGAVPLKPVPLESVPEMVPEPVTAKDNVVELPLQMVAVPLRTAVGLGLTVIVVFTGIEEMPLPSVTVSV